MEMGNITGMLAGWLGSGIFWTLGILLIGFLVMFFYIYMSRRSKLKYICLELVPFGNGKVGVNRTKAGLFKRKTWFFGLIDYGAESVYKVADGRIIQNAKTSQLHDIMGKKGFVVTKKHDDPKILVPINKVRIENLEILLEIAPADYREASTTIIQNSIKETQSNWEKIMPYVAIGIIVMLCIVSIIINQQMTNNTVNKVGNMLIEGCQNTANTQPSGAP